MSRPKINISKIKISGDDEIHIEFSEHTSQGPKFSKDDYPFKPHDDFKKVFKDLVPHICKLAEQYDKDGKTISATYDPNSKKSYMRCCGISISGDDEKESIIFTAVRYLSTGKTITINTPGLLINAEESSYPEMDELIDVLVALNNEARAFLFDEKYAPDVQGSLQFDDSDSKAKKKQQEQEDEEENDEN